MRQGGSQQTNFTMGYHPTEYNTVSKLQAPEKGKSYRHANRGAAANRKASWNTGGQESTWQTESKESSKFVPQPKSLLEAKPDFIGMDKQRTKAPTDAAHKPGHKSSVYIGLALKGNDWGTEQGGAYTKKGLTAQEAAEDRDRVAAMKHNVRKSNLRLTDHSKDAYESTSRAQLFDPTRHGPGTDARGTMVDKKLLNKTNFHMGSEPTDYQTTAKDQSNHDTLNRATRDQIKEQQRINAASRETQKTNIKLASEPHDPDTWKSNAVKSFPHPSPRSYQPAEAAHRLRSQVEAAKTASKDNGEFYHEKPDHSEFWKDHRAKPVDASAARKANFSLGQHEVDYKTHTQAHFQQHHEDHYKEGGAVGGVQALRASNFTLGLHPTDYRSHTHSTHNDDHDDLDD